MHGMQDARLASGQYGVFEGSSRDQVVLAEYEQLGTWAPEVVSLVVGRLFGDGPGTFIDVGANIGLVCIPIVEQTGALGIAFEPEPRNFGYLTRNVARHGLDERLECLPLACYSENTTLSLALSGENLGDHRLEPSTASVTHDSREHVQVRAVTLDDALRGRELPGPIVLKVDAQGSEVRVFEGAHETLARADYVISEYWPEGIVAMGDDPARFREIMRRFDFGAVLRVQALPEPLNSSQHIFEQLTWFDDDGSDPGFFDVLLSRHWVLPNYPPELHALKMALLEGRTGT